MFIAAKDSFQSQAEGFKNFIILKNFFKPQAKDPF